MTLDAAGVQAIILDQVGDTDDAAVSRQLAVLWDYNAEKAAVAPKLQALYTKRDAIEIVRGAVRDEVDQSTDGTGLRQTQRMAHLNAMYASVEAEIQVVEARAAANRAGVLGTITTTVAVPGPVPTFGPPDGNDPRYSGSVYAPLRGVLP